ncbi:hypothetical protein ACHOLT_11675 [Desulfitobacterium sp. Sab5]|uniref:hypothetical protein n=1 Tax=Desulfitobacterium nosdiversum TaxID=3375356 RepID=UPI003CED2E4C
MKSFIGFFSNRSHKEKVGATIGVTASILGIVLWMIFIFYNPYVKDVVTDEQLKITFVRLGLPAACILVASVVNQAWLLYITFAVSLPFYGYMAGTPGIFRLFGLVSVGSIVSAILITIGKRQRRSIE